MVKKLFKILLLIMLLPLIASAAIIMGANTNSSVPYPIVVTNAATLITGSTATLNGTAYNYNSAGTSYFNYGTTSSYGSQTSSIAFAGNTTTTSFSANTTGLSTATIYHFQACVSNAAGPACGSDLTFTTPGTGNLVRTASLDLSAVCNPQGVAIDTTNQIGYITCGGFNTVKKVDLTTMTQTGSLTLTGPGWLSGLYAPALYSAGGSTLYVAINSSSTSRSFARIAVPALTFIDYPYWQDIPAGVALLGSRGAKINQSNGSVWFSSFNVCSLAECIWKGDGAGNHGLSTGYNMGSIAFDNVNNIVYSGNVGLTHAIYRFTSGFGNVTSFNAGSDGIAIGPHIAVDTIQSNQVYFSGDGKLYKSPLTDITAPTQFGNPSSFYIYQVEVDPTLQFIYFATNTAPAKIVSVAMSNFTQNTILTLGTGEDNNYTPNCQSACMQIDTVNHYMYYATQSGFLVKVQLL